MEINQIAYLYVTYIEPLLKILAFGVLVIIVLHVFNAMRDGKKHSEIIGMTFNGMVKVFVYTFIYLGRGIRWIGEMLLKVIKIIFASIRDFFTSQI